MYLKSICKMDWFMYFVVVINVKFIKFMYICKIVVYLYVVVKYIM